jgi:hypothetical protein
MGVDTMVGGSALRWVRALTLALVMTTSALAGHVASDGVISSTALLPPLFVLVTVLVWPYVGAPLSSVRVVILLFAGQGALHVVLQASGGTDASAETRAAASDHLLHLGADAASSSMPIGVMTWPDLAMLLAHVAGALVVGLWLAAGERATWKLLAIMTQPVVGVWVDLRGLWATVPVPVLVRRPDVIAGWGGVGLVQKSLCSPGGLSRRGPPVCGVA